MSKFHEKVEGRTKQTVGQMIGDDQLVREGKTQERRIEDDRSGRGDRSAPHQEMAHSDQGIVKDRKASEQRKDKERAQLVHKTDANNSVSREATGTRAPDDDSPGDSSQVSHRSDE
jgi:hypothetical protein